MKTKEQNQNRIIILLLLIVAIWGSCQKESTFDKVYLIENLSKDYVLPKYQALKQKNIIWQQACQAFVENPTSISLQQVQDNWKVIMQIWSEVEMLNFGPGRTAYRYLQLDNTPINTISIENAIASTVSIDSIYIANRSSYTKGLAAIEYLIFDASGNQQLLLDKYVLDTNKIRRATYLLACIKNTQALFDQLYQEWTIEGGNYITRISQETGNSTEDGIGNFSNAIIHISQTMASKKLGKPLGKTSSDKLLHLEYLESPYAHFSWEIILYNLKGLKQIFGDQNKGLGNYLSFKRGNNELTNKITTQILEIEALIEARSTSLHIDLQMNTSEVELLYQKIRSLYLDLLDGMAGSFEITVFANSDDGD